MNHTLEFISLLCCTIAGGVLAIYWGAVGYHALRTLIKIPSARSGLKIAAAIRKDGVLDGFVKNRYRSFDSGIGKKIEKGQVGFAELEKYMLDKGEITGNESGRQEYLENLINDYV